MSICSSVDNNIISAEKTAETRSSISFCAMYPHKMLISMIKTLNISMEGIFSLQNKELWCREFPNVVFPTFDLIIGVVNSTREAGAHRSRRIKARRGKTRRVNTRRDKSKRANNRRGKP